MLTLSTLDALSLFLWLYIYNFLLISKTFECILLSKLGSMAFALFPFRNYSFGFSLPFTLKLRVCAPTWKGAHMKYWGQGPRSNDTWVEKSTLHIHQHLLSASACRGPGVGPSWGYCLPMEVARVSEKNSDPRAPCAGLGENHCCKEGCWTTEPEGFPELLWPGLLGLFCGALLVLEQQRLCVPRLQIPRPFQRPAPRRILCPVWHGKNSPWVRKRKANTWYWPYVKSKPVVPMRLLRKLRHRWRKLLNVTRP